MTDLIDASSQRAAGADPRRLLGPMAAVPGAVLLLGLPAAAVPWLAEVPHPEQTVLLVLDLLLLAASLTIGVCRGFRPLLALSATFVLAWIVLPSLYQLSHHLAAWDDNEVVDLRGPTTAALALTAVAQASLLVGYGLSLVLRPRDDHGGRRGRRSTPNGYPVLAPLLVLASLAALPVVARTLGGVQVLFASRSGITDAAADAGIALNESGGIGVALLRVVPMALAVSGTLLAIQFFLRKPRTSWQRFVAVSTAVLGGALVIVYANPLANSRFTALAAIGSIALLLARPRRPAAGILVVSAFTAFMLFAYPLANAFRGDGASRLDVQDGGGVFAYLASRDYDGFQQIVNTFLFVGEHGHTAGRYLLSAVLVFVPRSIWPDKATPASLDVAAARGYSFTDLSLPTNAELYLDFGWLSVVAVFLALGAVYARLDRGWLQGDRTAALVAFVALAQIGIIRGPLGSIVPVIDLTLLILILEAALAARTPSRIDDPSPRSA